MELYGEVVKHKVFGRGQIVEFANNYVTVLFDENKKDYIDFASGVGVNSLGYANKKVVKTIEKQAKKILHSSNIYRIKPQEKCAKKNS